MIRKGLQIINILALVLSGLAFSWVYSEHTDVAATKNEQLYTQKLQEVNNINKIDSLKSSYIEYINTSKKAINVHNYKAEKTINILISILILLGLNFIFLTILNEQLKNHENKDN